MLLKDIEERLNHVRSPFRTAEKFSVEDIIDPRDTRKELLVALERYGNKREEQPKRKHGNIPL